MLFMLLPVLFFAGAFLLYKDQAPPLYLYIIPAGFLVILIAPNPFGWEFPAGMLYVSLIATCIGFLAGLLIAHYWRKNRK